MAETKRKFQWTGLDSQGARVSGVVQAVDTNDAQAELKKMGVEVISLGPNKQIDFSFGNIVNNKKKIKNRDILLFTRYLSTMLASGLSIMQALDIIGRDQDNPSMRDLILSIRVQVSEGKTLAEAFGVHPEYFGELYCNLIKAGEKSGTLRENTAAIMPLYGAF